jgi:hypothetical protein
MQIKSYWVILTTEDRYEEATKVTFINRTELV